MKAQSGPGAGSAAGFLLGLAVMLAVSLPARAADGFLESYKQGLAAVESRDWSAAVGHMQEAIAGRSKSAVRLRRGLYLRRYLPHYYLGLALYGTGDCAGAVAAWEESLRQGVVSRFPEAAILEEHGSTCGSRLGEARQKLTEAIEAAEEAVARAESEAAVVADLAARSELPEGWAEGDPAPGEVQGLGEELLEQARTGLEEGRRGRDLGDLARATELAGNAFRKFELIRSEVERRVSAGQEERVAALSRLDGVIARGRQAMSRTELLRPFPPRLGRLRGEIDGQLRRAQSLSSSASAEELAAFHDEIAESLAAYGRAVAPPPRVLREAAGALFRGDYEGVLEILKEATFSGRRALAHAHLFRAAARFSLWVGSGERREDLLDAAGLSVLACREADPSRAPTISAFSPRFIEFFDRYP